MKLRAKSSLAPPSAWHAPLRQKMKNKIMAVDRKKISSKTRPYPPEYLVHTSLAYIHTYIQNVKGYIMFYMFMIRTLFLVV